MSYALNSPKLLVRDIENFSKENSIAQNSNENKFIFILKLIGNTIAKIIHMNIQLNQSLKILRVSIKNDYQKFSHSEHREKEDILIKWERLSHKLNDRAKKIPSKSSVFTKGIRDKSLYIVAVTNQFVGDMHSDLYPNMATPLSQEYLKELEKRFSHLPNDVLNDLRSEEYSECL
ncbi:hypothetical protein HDF18_14360 [Mucilaginibacter sp. X5P1]|uniref:hypothetical protein n=1 Tax=Mucilaginibacter sp. X5P1 TaxID=2723088 RepID=UPI001619438C|nr:hypothetical protein [Mucilaginibacter sp. X5P1]MBB6138786.1 hypothetical protein [Mucilaginibacter sp. X5P1]